MVQQVSLVSSIDDSSLALCLKTLTAISSTPAIKFENINVMYKPVIPRDIDMDNTGEAYTHEQQNRLKLSTTTNTTKPTTISGLINTPEKLWAISASDIPAAGNNREVSLQNITESLVNGTENGINVFMTSLGFELDFCYKSRGYRIFYQPYLIIDIYKIEHYGDINNLSTTDITSGGYLIRAYSNVEQVTDIENIKRATTSLLHLKRTLRGYIDLQVPDRQAMDSKIRDY
ncbi:Srb5p SCDLUD_002317 [Saccharomycodes ludwigii]|uniref:Srb5p n=1 Tax=Saccharomycodes ludwigii TaxID=36035 RepID=UPI001E854FA3|nr:hypothetical protein SCDLUD_002317 [Saccharomycodes ludwigii]KAH3900862.1 hypothetical protein SCDLUD_002317 [Saccharomycodes ludwigii]